MPLKWIRNETDKRFVVKTKGAVTMPVQTKLFISHAAVDAPVVKAFVNLLEVGVGVDPKTIFCTANKGQGVRPGAEFKASIRENLDGATTVVALISENFYNSAFSMCELGGTWLQAKDFIPVLIPPISFADMKAVLSGLQAIKIESQADLDQLRDEVAERLCIKALSTPRWNEKRDEFLNELPAKLKLLPKHPVVTLEQLQKAELLAAEYKEALKTAKDDNAKLGRVNAKLKETKDAKVVSKIERAEMEAADVFDALVKTASKALKKLLSITQESIYLSHLGEDYFPGRPSARYDWDDATSALQYKEVSKNSEDNGVSPNGDNAQVGKALDAIHNLNRWLTREAPEDFITWYEQENDGRCPDLSDRAFWDSHFWA